MSRLRNLGLSLIHAGARLVRDDVEVTLRPVQNPKVGEWRCGCTPKDPAFDNSINPKWVSRCHRCMVSRP